MRLRIAILFTLLIGIQGCATGPDPWETYAACQRAHTIPKVNENGVVAMDKQYQPIMIPNPDACTAENEAYNKYAEALERRRVRTEVPTCGRGYTLYCEGHGVRACTKQAIIHRRCQCACIDQNSVRQILRGWQF